MICITFRLLFEFEGNEKTLEISLCTDFLFFFTAILHLELHIDLALPLLLIPNCW